jgi:ribosomal protein S18 acetylase RimI-like enzyme
MIEIAPVDPSQVYRAFMEAFADYAMKAGATREDTLLLRMAKNAVDCAASPGAYEGRRLVGFTLIGIDAIEDRLIAYDAGTGIIPAFRGQGLAKRMFDHALPGLRSRGVQRFLLEVLQSNEPAIRAYTKAGFAVTRELRSYVAAKEHLASLPVHDRITVRAADATTFESLSPESDWAPSFENRFSAHRFLPGQVAFLAAHDGPTCVGTAAYCAKLNWLLSLLIKPSHRRRGVGTALLRHVAALMPEAAARLAALNVDGGDAGMQAFFLAAGFDHLVDQYEMSLNV